MAVTVQDADAGDTQTMRLTTRQAGENLRAVAQEPESERESREAVQSRRSGGESSPAHVGGQDRDAERGETEGDGGATSGQVCRESADCAQCSDTPFRELVTDKGYHSNATVREYAEAGVRTYMSEPERRGRRHWKDKAAERAAVYGNRRRIRGERGKALLRRRGELLERPFAHCYDTGGMRRVHLRGHGNILKRVLAHVAGFNLGLVMRAMFGIGKPRGLRDRAAQALLSLVRALPGRLGGIAAALLQCPAFAGRSDESFTHIFLADHPRLAAA